MGVSADAPWTDMAYKLVAYDGRPVLKLSTGKISLPGEKQVHRHHDDAGALSHDVVSLRDENPDGGESLLAQAMDGGRILGPVPTLEEIRKRFTGDFEGLAEACKALRAPQKYKVSLSPGLGALYHRLERQVAGTTGTIG